MLVWRGFKTEDLSSVWKWIGWSRSGASWVPWQQLSTPMEQPGWPHSKGSQGVVHDWASSLLLNQAAWYLLLQVIWQYVSPNQSKNRLGHPHSQRAPPMISWLLKRDSVCELWVSLCSSECVGKHVTLKLEFQVIWQKSVYCSCESRLAASNQPGKQTGSFFLCTMTTALVHSLSFLKGTCCWPLLTGKATPSPASPNC